MRWFILAPLSLVLSAISFLGAPLLVLLADKNGNLPCWLSWLQTDDATLDGDLYWQDPSAHPRVNRLPRYCRRVLWMWRNPGGGFDQDVAGVDITQRVRCCGDAQTSNQPGHAGFCFARCHGGWMLYWVWPWGFGRCVRVYLGWKLMQAVQQADYRGRLPLVLSINPLMGFQAKRRG